jgi:spermidine synthase
MYNADINHEFRRNFFGVVIVQEYAAEESDNQGFQLIHGNTIHGLQLTNEYVKGFPATYYSYKSGIGHVLMEYPHTRSMRVGIVGMGIGTLSVYAKPGDEYRFFEINPDVISLARDDRYFYFVNDAEKRGAMIDIIQGDGRLSMEREAMAAGQPLYEVVVLDAFSSDSIPMHLLTKEAFTLYFSLLKEDGVLAVHISNEYLDLFPVITAIADTFNVHAIVQTNSSDPGMGVFYSKWILLTNNPYFVENYYTEIYDKRRILWTDDFCNLWSVMEWK